jgi:hypothetical protein
MTRVVAGGCGSLGRGEKLRQPAARAGLGVTASGLEGGAGCFVRAGQAIGGCGQNHLGAHKLAHAVTVGNQFGVGHYVMLSGDYQFWSMRLYSVPAL